MKAHIVLMAVLALGVTVPGLSAQETIPEIIRAGGGGLSVVDSFDYAPSMADLYRNCETVVLGRVVASRVHLSEDETEIWTEYTVEVHRVVSARKETEAPAPGSSVVVDVPGGTLLFDGKPFTYEIDGMPTLYPEEKAFLFLTASPLGAQAAGYRVPNGPEGIFRVRNGLVEHRGYHDEGHPSQRYRGMLESEFEREILRTAEEAEYEHPP